jgi:hypothetical protein
VQSDADCEKKPLAVKSPLPVIIDADAEADDEELGRWVDDLEIVPDDDVDMLALPRPDAETEAETRIEAESDLDATFDTVILEDSDARLVALTHSDARMDAELVGERDAKRPLAVTLLE